MTTARPPWVSVPMGVLAGRPFEPAKRSAIHGRQREQNATVKWAGDWRRAYDYGDPEAEARRGPRVRGRDRRLDARQAAGARPGRRRAARPALPEPVLEPQAGPDPLRRDDLRRRPDHGRRHDLPARRRLVLRHDHVERRGRDRGVVRLVAGHLGPGGARHRRHPGALRGQPRGPEGARDPRRPDRPRHLARGLRLPRRQAGQGGRRRRAAAADRLRRRGRLRDPLPGRLRRARLGRARRGRRAAVRARAAADPAAAEAARDRRPGHRLRVDALRRGDAVDRQARQGAGLHRPLGARARRGASGRVRAGRLHDGERARPDRGRGGAARRAR